MTTNKIISMIIACFERKGKLLIFGNGGSCAESSHLAAEFIGKGLPAIALNDPTVLTALANDFSYKEVFERQVFALGQPKDIAIGISSSGKSKNIIKGLAKAKRMNLDIIDWPRIGKDTSEIQDNQLRLIHEVYLAVDQYFNQE